MVTKVRGKASMVIDSIFPAQIRMLEQLFKEW
jgi:hypothetical protein